MGGFKQYFQGVKEAKEIDRVAVSVFSMNKIGMFDVDFIFCKRIVIIQKIIIFLVRKKT